MTPMINNGILQPCPDPFNMAAHVLSVGHKTPDKTALCVLSSDGFSADWSYGDLRGAILSTATGLLQHGLVPNDIVLMRLGNTVDFPIAYLGALAAGLVPVPTSAALTTRETAQIIDDLAPKLILQAPGVACPDHPCLVSLAALQRMRTLPPAAFHLGDPNRMGYVIYTSGTSGRPRAVAHAHRAIRARQMMFDGWSDLRPDDRLLHAGAFNWTYTLGTGLMDPWTIGATAIIPAPGTSAKDLPALLNAHKATIFAAAPSIYRQILKHHHSLNLSTLRHGLSAGEKLPDLIRANWQKATSTSIYEAYGMSECSTFISSCPARPAQSGALGMAQPGRCVALFGDQGPVRQGCEGTIAVHQSDPGLMLGYLNAPEETATRYRGDWFLTGDHGVMDADGQITYLGRNDDMMNAGGYRVSPIEVERALASCPGVTAIAAVDVEVKAHTRVIAAFYCGPVALDDAILRSYANNSLARYKQPRVYIHVPKLPTGANGKLLRRDLRAQFEAKNDQT